MDSFPDDVRQFLEANIDSIGQLEMLRVLESDSARYWTSNEIATQIQETPEMTLTHLTVLQARGLLTCEQRNGCCVGRYGAQSPELDDKLRRLLELYKQRPVTMIRMLYDRSSTVLRNFADAFRLRPEK